MTLCPSSVTKTHNQTVQLCQHTGVSGRQKIFTFLCCCYDNKSIGIAASKSFCSLSSLCNCATSQDNVNQQNCFDTPCWHQRGLCPHGSSSSFAVWIRPACKPKIHWIGFASKHSSSIRLVTEYFATVCKEPGKSRKGQKLACLLWPHCACFVESYLYLKNGYWKRRLCIFKTPRMGMQHDFFFCKHHLGVPHNTVLRW